MASFKFTCSVRFCSLSRADHPCFGQRRAEHKQERNNPD